MYRFLGNSLSTKKYTRRLSSNYNRLYLVLYCFFLFFLNIYLVLYCIAISRIRCIVIGLIPIMTKSTYTTLR